MDAFLRSPLGALLARPWLDRAGLFGLERWYFPLSRLWAAANAAGTDVARFREEVGAPLGAVWTDRRLRGILEGHAVRSGTAAQARSAWESALFDGGPRVDPSADAGLLDARRRASSSSHMAMRAAFYPLLFPRRPPPARWRIDPPSALEQALATALAEPERLYRQPLDIAAVSASRPFERGAVRERWLRAPTPADRLRRRPGSEHLYARLVEPRHGGAAATLVLGGGLGLELELLTLSHDPATRLAAQGWRVVEPIAPYHGLRAMPGRYGGEPFYAEAPGAAIDLVAGHALEWGLIVAWCRARYGGPVALSGISMTSFVAQQVASRCGIWTAEARPDAVMLISHSGSIEDVTFDGALTLSLGLDQALVKAGWSREALSRLSRLVDPAAAPALPPGQIVSVLGETDRWLPFNEGLAVAQTWRLPPENVFRYPLGHLGMPVQLMRDPAPFERLRQVMDVA
ncbi:MAG: hypothetical protein ACOY4R_08830 [Pseudomonadota bacterium]